MSDRNLAYYADRCQQIAQELQSVGYQLASLAQGARTLDSNDLPSVHTLYNLGGTVARLRVQTDHTLTQLLALIQAAEDVAPK